MNLRILLNTGPSPRPPAELKPEAYLPPLLPSDGLRHRDPRPALKMDLFMWFNIKKSIAVIRLKLVSTLAT